LAFLTDHLFCAVAMLSNNEQQANNAINFFLNIVFIFIDYFLPGFGKTWCVFAHWRQWEESFDTTSGY
jgi:hypothetical protein